VPRTTSTPKLATRSRLAQASGPIVRLAKNPRCALHLEEHGAMTLNIGRNAIAPEESCRLEAAGTHLLYCIVLDGAGGLSLSVVPLDSPALPDLLLQTVDGAAGWDTLHRLCAALERHEIKALHPRPLEVGPPGPDCFVIA
jgi:hypothetical protein